LLRKADLSFYHGLLKSLPSLGFRLDRHPARSLEIYQTSERVTEGKERMIDWLESASELYGQVIQTINNHLAGIANYFISRTTSGTMEGINNKIKLLKQGYGFPTSKTFS